MYKVGKAEIVFHLVTMIAILGGAALLSYNTLILAETFWKM